MFAARRKALLDAMGQGVMIIPAPPTFIRNNDVEHEYRQDSDFYYLTGFAEPDAVLVLTTAHPDHRCVLFVRPRDPDREVWDGARAGVDGAVRDFGADAAFPIAELAQRLPDYLQNHERLLYRIGRDRIFDEKMLAALDATRARVRRAISWPVQMIDPASILHEMRLFKSQDEIVAMQRAAAITRDGHLAAMQIAKPGRHEYEVEAALRQVFRQNGSERPAYAPIVGSGPNATVLHYRQNDRRIEAGDLLLVDAGCEFGYYASDVTRTFPVNGKFTRPQEAIYRIVLDEQLYRPFYMHRTSHWLGMDVHDVGAYFRDHKPRPLEAGMVITIEPGIYIAISNTAVPPEYRGIGVRIEDDVLLTPEGNLNLTADIPKSVSEIERACA
jgi:Xaa-Pro aminopeptidase